MWWRSQCGRGSCDFSINTWINYFYGPWLQLLFWPIAVFSFFAGVFPSNLEIFQPCLVRRLLTLQQGALTISLIFVRATCPLLVVKWGWKLLKTRWKNATNPWLPCRFFVCSLTSKFSNSHALLTGSNGLVARWHGIQSHKSLVKLDGQISHLFESIKRNTRKTLTTSSNSIICTRWSSNWVWYTVVYSYISIVPLPT